MVGSVPTFGRYLSAVCFEFEKFSRLLYSCFQATVWEGLWNPAPCLVIVYIFVSALSFSFLHDYLHQSTGRGLRVVRYRLIVGPG